MSVWKGRKDDIQRMADDGLTDGEIGFVYGVTGSQIGGIRKKLGITRKGKPQDPEPLQPIEGEPLVGVPFTDEQGRPGKRYPARWAEGALVESFTVRPRRG